MGLFDPVKPKVSKKEFARTSTYLRSQGFSASDISNVKKTFRGDLDEADMGAGIDPKELARGVDWLRSNMGKHSLSKTQIDKLEENMKKKL